MLKSLLLINTFFFVTTTAGATDSNLEGDLSEHFLVIFDVDKSQKLEKQELINAFEDSIYGEILRKAAGLEKNQKLEVQLWFYLFEYGKVPASLAEMVKFTAYYAQKNHNELAIDAHQVEKAIEVLNQAIQ